MSDQSIQSAAPQRRCSRCGELMAVHTLRGLCPNCLALFAFAPEEDGGQPVTPQDPSATVVIPPPAALAADVRFIGDYELLEEIGRGGMGVVFRARQASLNRPVAVKMILSGEFAAPEERRRFQREAEAAAQLRHPNIVSVHQVGEHEGRSYYSMDLIEGCSLSAALRADGTMPPERAAAMVKILAEAVHFAHQRGTLHRDLKPQNILLDAEGQPHILDFGLARPVEREAGLTRTGDVLGSPSYMPPEQAAGRQADIGPASDVYALGAILYEAITASPPFQGESPMDVLSQVIDQNPLPPRKLNAGVPADLETICLKCLEKHPERRYHSARMLAEELERFLNAEPILARPAGRLRRSWSWAQRNPWIFAAAFGLAALMLACVCYGLVEELRYQKEQTGATMANAAAGPRLAGPTRMDSEFDGIQAAPATTVEMAGARSPAMLYVLSFPGLCWLLYFAGRVFLKKYRRQVQGGPALSDRAILLHAAAGIGAVVLALDCLLRQIQSWVRGQETPVLWFEGAAVACALALMSVGARMVWEAVGIHQTSRFRALVSRAMDQRSAGEARRWRMINLFGATWYLIALIALGLWLGVQYRVQRYDAVISEPQDYVDSAKDWFARIAGILLSMGVAALAAWAVRRRRRLFVFLCVPMALAGFAFLFVTLTANRQVVGELLINYLVSAFLTAGAVFFTIKRRPGSGGGVSRFPANPWLDIAYGVAFVIGLAAFLNVVEDRRGKAAWDKCKRDLQAKGATLNWSALVPPPIPDDQNVFKAPKMQEWFAGWGKNELSRLLETSPPWARPGNSLVQITLLPMTNQSPNALSGADLVLSWSKKSLTVFPQDPSMASTTNVAAALESVRDQRLGRMLELRAGLGNVVLLRPLGQMRPARIVLVYDVKPTMNDLRPCFTNYLPDAASFEPDGAGFRLTGMRICSAEDVLAWSEKCEPQLETIRRALQRPLARPDGNYDDPRKTPLLNLPALSALTDMLGCSAQAYLLRGDPEMALRQLTLFHDARRLLEGPLNGFISASVDSHFARVFAGIIQDGLRLHAWKDPQLAVLGGQLKQIDFPACLQRSSRFEQVEMLSRCDRPKWADLTKMTNFDSPGDPSFGLKQGLFLRLAPQGWLDKNKVAIYEASEPAIEDCDSSRQLVQPRKVDEDESRQKLRKLAWPDPEFSLYAPLRDVFIIPIGAWIKPGVRTQTRVVQARIACALERYRLAHGKYPGSLDALVPQFLGEIPRDLIGGQPPLFRRDANGDFQLSSPAWNEKDRWTWLPK